MTAFGEPPQPAPPPPAPLPVPVIGYATAGAVGLSTGVKVLLTFLACLHLLIGIPLVLWPLATTMIGLIGMRSVDSGSFVLIFMGLVTGVPNILCGLWMLVRRTPRTWRITQALLFVLCGIDLVLFSLGATACITSKHETGWGALGLVIGAFLAIVATVLFALHAVSKLLLLRVNVRRAFLFDRDEPVRLQRTGAIAILSLYGLLLLVASVWYALA